MPEILMVTYVCGCIALAIHVLLGRAEADDSELSAWNRYITTAEQEHRPGCRVRPARELTGQEPSSRRMRSWHFFEGMIFCAFAKHPSKSALGGSFRFLRFRMGHREVIVAYWVNKVKIATWAKAA